MRILGPSRLFLPYFVISGSVRRRPMHRLESRLGGILVTKLSSRQAGVRTARRTLASARGPGRLCLALAPGFSSGNDSKKTSIAAGAPWADVRRPARTDPYFLA